MAACNFKAPTIYVCHTHVCVYVLTQAYLREYFKRLLLLLLLLLLGCTFFFLFAATISPTACPVSKAIIVMWLIALGLIARKHKHALNSGRYAICLYVSQSELLLQ